MTSLIVTSLIVTLEIRPDGVEDFIGWISEAAHDARTLEAGCRRFEVVQLDDRPNVFTLAELYDDTAALEEHRRTPHFLLLKQRLEDGGLLLNKTSALGTVLSS